MMHARVFFKIGARVVGGVIHTQLSVTDKPTYVPTCLPVMHIAKEGVQKRTHQMYNIKTPTLKSLFKL